MTTFNFHLIEKSFLSIKTTRIITTCIGAIYFLLFILSSNWDEPNFIPKYLNLIFATFWIIYPQFMFNENSSFAPKVKISNDHIILKNDLWSRSKKIKWTDIKSIQFNSFRLYFTLREEQFTFNYSSDADTSIQIKEALREIAKDKNITILGA